MKIVKEEFIIKKGAFSKSQELSMILQYIRRAINLVTWPENSSSFFINPTPKGNGVKPIKEKCMKYLQQQGWILEKRISITSENNAGPIDALLGIGNKFFAIEWETGNISSSHRALNKMAVGMLSNVLIGGILILPSRSLYRYLTDRVGNFSEIQPYFTVWKSLNIKNGILGIFEIEHDSTSCDVPLIPKGTDGRALS